MRKHHGWALTALAASLGLVLAFAAPAFSEKPAAKDKDKDTGTLKGRVASRSKQTEEIAGKVLDVLGPVVRDKLAHGEVVELPGLGVFRVVQVAEHKDLVNGRPATIPASNYVEFLPGADLVDAANAPGAVPAATVPQFEYNPLPDQTKSQHVPDERAPSVRTR